MVLTKDIWLPTDAELTVEEIPLGTPSLRAGAMHLGKYCEAKNNDFMLCRNETQAPKLHIHDIIRGSYKSDTRRSVVQKTIHGTK